MEYYKANENDCLNISKKEIQIFAEKAASSLGFIVGKSMKEFAEKQNIKVSYFSIENEVENHSGFIKIDKANKKIEIELSNFTTELRNNFTIAHEIAHLLIHSKHINHDLICFDRHHSNRLEWEANWFAAAFLMPEKLFRQKVKEFGGSLINLSIYFNVSKIAIKIRKKDLNID